MAKRRKTGRMPPALKRYWQGRNRKAGKRRKKSYASRSASKKHHKGVTVAKRKKKKGGSRRGRRGGGGFGSIANGLPIAEVVAGAAVGFIEKESKADPNFLLNKLPTPVAQLGRTGNIVLLAWAANKFGIVPASMRKHVSQGIKAGAAIVAYQLTRQGKAFDKGDAVFSISGPAPDGGLLNSPHRRRSSATDDEYISGDDEIGDAADDISGHHYHGTIDIEEDDEVPPEPEHHDEDHPSNADQPAAATG